MAIPLDSLCSLPEEVAIAFDAPITAASLRPYLESLGYRRSMLRADFEFGEGQRVAIAGFAHPPADARSSCIVALDATDDIPGLVRTCRQIGAPVVLVCRRDALECWKQGAAAANREGAPIPSDQIPQFFEKHADDFAPDAVYRAKTWGRFDTEFQLRFVDVGLMPVVENEIGKRLEELIVRNVSRLKAQLAWHSISEQQGAWLLKTVFWLTSAKILRDKGVRKFESLELGEVESVFATVAQHYDAQTISIATKAQIQALERVATDVEAFSNLSLATTESLAYVYENTLISRATRRALGTHSTPTYLVDYVVGKLRPWIEEIPEHDRNVFEPACGHAAFLVSAMRLLTELLPADKASPARRRQYLRNRIHGCEIDAFALEIARLSLTLADVPNPDGWDLRPLDMFTGTTLQLHAQSATIFLANPPFQNFSKHERIWYKNKGTKLQFLNKTVEILASALPHLARRSVLGVVVPQGLLHHKNAVGLRELLADRFDIKEICLFPDKVFRFSDMESAVIIGRKRSRRTHASLSYRRVRERDMDAFKIRFAVTTDRKLSQSRFESPTWDMRIPELEDVWDYCARNEKLEHIAEVGQGLTYKGQSLPEGARTVSDRPFAGAVKGFVRFDRGLSIHKLPVESWLNIRPNVVLRSRHGVEMGNPQVLTNEAPASRGPWRLKALIDREGHAVTGRFNVVRATRTGIPLEFFWALCNSPITNAYMYTHGGKRHNDAGMLRKMPIPDLRESGITAVVDATRRYFEYIASDAGALATQSDAITARSLILRVDNAILRLYALPTILEWQLLDLFANWTREGVPFSFDTYFPEDVGAHLALQDYLDITENWAQTNTRRGELIRRKREKAIDETEKQELRHMQKLASCHRRLIAPIPLDEIEELHRTLVGDDN